MKKFPFGNLTFRRNLGLLVPCGERSEICMSEEKQRRITGKSGGAREAWLAALGWGGIFLPRLLLGFVVWVALTVVTFFIAARAHPEAEFIRDFPRWFFIVILLLPILVIVLMGFLFSRGSGERREIGRIAVEPPLDDPREAPAISTKTGELSPTDSMAPALAAGAEGGYFYVGPDNEPVGPISWAVLLQLRRSGTIEDETFVAREGESDWGPLKPRLAELESPQLESVPPHAR